MAVRLETSSDSPSGEIMMIRHVPARKGIAFPEADYWPVKHRRLRIRKKYRNRWPDEVRSFWNNFLGLHTRWTNWKSYLKKTEACSGVDCCCDCHTKKAEGEETT